MAIVCLFLYCMLPASSFAAPPPVITVQPLDQSVLRGDTATFTVVATSSTTLTYQWYEDGLLFLDKKLNGQTSSTLTLTNVSSADEGRYFVAVKNSGGTVITRKAELTINAPPVANNDTYTTVEDMSLIVPVSSGILANDVDVDGDALTAVLVSNVSHGVLSLDTNGAFSYTPNTNFNGSDRFTYRALDDVGKGASTVLEESIVSRNKVEIKAGQKGAQSFRHGTAGEPNYSISKVVLNLSTEATRPNTNVNFSIGTGVNTGALPGSSVTIAPLGITNTSSGSSFQRYEIVYATPVGPFTAGSSYYLNLECEASNGKRIWSDYDDKNNYSNGTYYKGGSDDAKDITFQVFGNLNSDTATVVITVTPVNDAPIALDDITNTLEDVSVTVNVLANDTDPDGTPLKITGTSTTNGMVVISGTNIVFTPSTNFNGVAAFNYTVSDGTNSATANVTVVVAPVNDAPIASNDTYTALEDVPLTIAAAGILANDLDVDGDVLTSLLVSDAAHGSLSLNADGAFTYTPYTNYFGSDSFTYSASDGYATGNVATVTINITPVYDPPQAHNDSTNTLEDVSVTVNVLDNDYDPDGTPLTITGTSTTNGTAVISGTNIVFTPSTNFNGVVVFNYTVSDGTNPATANVTVTVAPVNDAPIANDDTYTTLQDVPLTIAVAGILTNDLDVDADVLTAVIESDVNHGTLSLNPDGSFTYTPAGNYVGDDSFTYHAYDGIAASAGATVTITVLSNTPLNLSPGVMTPGGFSFQLSGTPASAYVIEASTNLTEWTPISTNSGLTGSVLFTDTDVTSFGKRYYRGLAR